MIEIRATDIRLIASNLIGIPYKNFGRDPKQGLDCYGACIEFYKRLGIVLPDPVSTYDRHWAKTDNYIVEHEQRFFDVHQSGERGDLAVCKILAPVPNHLMVILDDIHALNCSAGVGVHLLRKILMEKYVVHYLRHRNLKIISN